MIKMSLSENNGLFTVEAEGHAGFDPGHDIVCAAASMLIQTLHCSLLNGVGDSVLEEAELSHGKARLKFRGGKELYDMTVIGVELLRRAYGENVVIGEV